jgi:hypothetical protein
MSAETVDTAATTVEVSQVPDGKETDVTQGAESAPATPESGEKDESLPDKVRSRFDELTKEKYDERREKEYWREQALRAQQTKPEPPKLEPEATQAGKKLADFGYDEEKYQDYLFQQAETRAAKAAESVLQKRQAEDARVHTITAHKARETKFAKDVPDYFEVAHHAPVTQSMAEIVMESDKSADLAYYLGKNPEIAARIAQLPERTQARELGRIEAGLTKPVAPVVSQAPAPAPRLGGSDSGTGAKPDTPDSDKLSDAEWTKRRNQQLAARKRN